MSNQWDHSAEHFDRYNNVLERLLGYGYIYEWLYQRQEVLSNGNGLILDYGCGSGKVAFDFSNRSKVKILAVDTSESMIEIAKKRNAHDLIKYFKIDGHDLSFIQDFSLDGAMFCFVLPDIETKSEIIDLLSQVKRKLKKGAPLALVDVNPEAVGVKFSTFQSGATHKIYREGDSRMAWLYLPNGETLNLHGYYWPLECYDFFFNESGFKEVSKLTPTLKSLGSNELNEYVNVFGDSRDQAEWHTPPFVLFRAH